MSNDIKNLYSLSFSILALFSMAYGLYYLEEYGLDVSQNYFLAGAFLFIIGKIIEYSITDEDAE